MKQLEAIWADSSTQWEFDFNHRNEIQESINNAINSQSDLVRRPFCSFMPKIMAISVPTHIFVLIQPLS